MMLEKLSINSELQSCVYLAFLILIWMGVAPAWYSWYAMSENGLWMKGIYGLLDGNALVNVPICIVLAFISYRWARRIWIDNDIRWYRPILVVSGLVVHYKKVLNGM